MATRILEFIGKGKPITKKDERRHVCAANDANWSIDDECWWHDGNESYEAAASEVADSGVRVRNGMQLKGNQNTHRSKPSSVDNEISILITFVLSFRFCHSRAAPLPSALCADLAGSCIGFVLKPSPTTAQSFKGPSNVRRMLTRVPPVLL